MTLLECPYCKKKANSFWSLGNSAYFFSTDKKCLQCNGRVKFKMASISITFLLTLISLIIVFGLAFFLYGEIKGTGIFIALLVIVYGLFLTLLSLCAKYFKFRLYLPKDDVKSHVEGNGAAS